MLDSETPLIPFQSPPEKQRVACRVAASKLKKMITEIHMIMNDNQSEYG
ncbi:MAG: hypothetical protein HKM89_15380 [Gemmatimonadales bacterium]|nr:hypothetical protein [Gemmatimonadales bacterium]